ncbi:MAG TPA: hypothetical protein PLV08_11600 [Flavobacteriales bacterium]|jgi:hypothetical protein|nr:hypothetical protein [Flavobacteriales bacterium]MCC6911032.1 hypothetical protein [Flavobacteriales bacterium]HQW04853.1 hypothetical protein [Flavobacteriales bacterium]HQX00429.1 hypothetical protein [Flavobacteriales bacterium]HQY00411.1 hypothetical protein [Flavobacteriales bacterium]
MRWLVLGMTRQMLIAMAAFSSSCYAQTVLWDTTLTVVSSSFRISAERDNNENLKIHVVKDQIDTITIRGPEGGVRFEDFNSDGFPDLVFSYLGNNRVSDLYLFDVEKESFTEVLGFRQVSDSQPVSGQLGLYYSYRRAGCADANWSSTLFEIRDNLVHELGEIEGIGCEEGQAQGIVVYKIVTLDKIFEVDRLPISTIDNYDEYKWGFLAEYWAANIGRFRN